LQVEIAQVLDGLGTDQRGVTGQHDDVVVRRESFAGDHQGMARSALFVL